MIRSRMRARAVALLAALAAVCGGLAGPVHAEEPASGWLHTDGARIVTADGEDATIKAISWFGMETSNCVPHGLWSIPLDQGMRQIASLGFTTVRVPFSNECLAAGSTSSVNPNVNPELQGLTPLQVLDAVVDRAAAAGLDVILDRHRPDSGAQSALWYTSAYDETRWIDDWRMLAQRYADQPAVVGVDLHNEPHGDACWGCGDPARDWRAAAERAGDAVLDVNPNLLIIVEGVERQPDGSTTWWGGGLAGAGAEPVQLSVPNRLVYSPHEYPASVYAQSWFSDPAYPANLESIWDRNWGYLATDDIAPVFVGEFGTRLQTDSDRAWLGALVGYLQRTGISFGYWSFNPNSGDTGGIVADDWTTPEQAKLDALAPILSPAPTPPSPTPAPTAGPPTPSPTPSTSASPHTPKPLRSGLPGPGARRSPHPGRMAPRFPRPAPEPPASGTGDALTATWMLQSAWQDGYVVELDVTARHETSGWTVSWSSPGATSVVGAWGVACEVTAGTVTCTGADWAGALAAGQTVRVGAQIAAPSAPADPEVEVAGHG